MSLLDGYEETYKQDKSNKQEEQITHTSLLDGYEELPNNIIEGGVSKNVRTYDSRFPDRNKNFFSNAGKDIKDTVTGLAGMVGNTANFVVGRPLMSVVKDHKFFTGEGLEDLRNLKEALPMLGEGIKENYGQGGLDMVNWQRIKEGQSPIQVDIPGLTQSFYAHPLNLLDLVGLGEVGKLNQVKNLSKGGQASKFSKNIGNKVVNPNYSENLVFNLGQRALETKPVQAVVSAIDNSPLRSTTDIAADFLGLSPDSRLLGQKGSEVRKAKLIEQANQTKNITERNKAIAENKANLSGLTDVEAKELVKSIESGGGQAYYPDFKNIDELKTAYKDYIEPYPADYTGKTYEQALKDFGVTDTTPKIIKTPIEDVNLRAGNIEHVYTRKDKTRPLSLNRAIDTIEKPLFITEDANGDKLYTKIYSSGDKTKNQLSIVGVDNEGNFMRSEMPVGSNSELLKDIKKGKIIYERRAGKIAPANNSITNLVDNINPKVNEIKNLLRNKVNENAEYYIKSGLLDKQTVHDLPINNYASIKYNKPIDSLTDAEKLDALKDIEKMPKEQQPFYIPMMYDDKLRAGDFFANSTKRYKPNELKHRSVGMGLEENKTGGKRIYDPVELANRLDAHRIKMVNTENMVNEIIDNFAKPLDLSKEKVLDGYVPFNPDAFMKFYRKSIDLNELTLRKLDELQNIDTALKSSVQEAIKTLPDDVVELVGAYKNNKIYQIPEDVAKTLMQGKNAKGVWEAMFDMTTAGFKRKVLGLSPKWFINNRIGNGIMAGLKGVSLTDYIKALNISDDLLPEALRTKSMYEAEKTIIGRTGGGNNSTFGNTMRLLGGEFIDTSELKGIQKVQAQLANTLGIPGKAMNTITDAMFKFNQKFEDWERKAAYIHSTNTVGKKMIKTAGQNITKQDELLKYVADNEELLNAVMKDVDNTLGDYINMTSTERRAIRKIVPFYSWFRTITRYTLSLPESNPYRANLVNKISMAMADENENLPEYQRAGIDTGFVANRTGKNLLLNYEHSIPFSTFGETVDNPTGLLNPIITQMFETSRGRREFMDRPFTSRNYENVFPNGYASLNPENLGEFSNDLPIGERIKALPIGLARTSIPGFDWLERVGIGGLQNYLDNGEFTPKDALFDTSLGGYNYNEGFSKRPKGWSNEEQLLRLLLPLQQEGVSKKRVKTKRNATKSLYNLLSE